MLETFLQRTENLPPDTRTILSVEGEDGYHWNGRLEVMRMVLLAHKMPSHRCQQQDGNLLPGFGLGYFRDPRTPGNNYHYLVDYQDGKSHRVSFCPWCGEKL